jgi:tetratricopeptide (TPR) repeat protein
MPDLEGGDQMHLKAAEGWIELGNHVEAHHELENITPQLRAHPHVLLLRVRIYQAAKNWNHAEQFAHVLTEIAPELSFGWIHKAYAFHELKRTTEAWDLLLPIADKFPDWLIRYNLACYACQLGLLKEALQWLEKALNMAESKEVKLMTLEDPDLQPLWMDISEI